MDLCSKLGCFGISSRVGLCPKVTPFPGLAQPFWAPFGSSHALKAPAFQQPAGPHSLRGRWWCGSRYFPSRGGTNGHPASPAIIALTLDALCKLSLLLKW